MKVVSRFIANLKILYKAIVLDLDDTLWCGTLSEIGVSGIKKKLCSKEGVPFIEFMKFIKTLASELGVFIAISSRNSSKLVEATMEELDEKIFPLKSQIDSIVINHNDKSDNIRLIAEQLSILPSSILFIDDNPIVRDEVKRKLPEVFVPEWATHNELVSQLIAGCIFERGELSLNSRNRRKQYRAIQVERINNFLPSLYVKTFDDIEHKQSIGLYSKSNQFKFSLNEHNFHVNAQSLYFEIFRESGENLGVCSAITYTLTDNTMHIHNWAISCRYFDIGLEEFILMQLKKVANANKIFINYQDSKYNQKVSELLLKYPNNFKPAKNDFIELILTKENIGNIVNNTNLREV